MGDLKGSRIAGGNTAYKRSESDFYPTPPDVTTALLDFLGISSERHVIWEPACGEGHMVRQMKKMGFSVLSSDILKGTDFLKDDPPGKFTWIITNPPFSQSEQFIKKCLEYKVPFALLLKSQYWHAKRRLQLFRDHPPTYILPLTWRPDFCERKRGGGNPLMDVMWCVWEINSRDSCMYIPLERPDKDYVKAGF